MRCAKKPRRKVHGYSRCPPGKVKGRRNTKAERRAKLCVKGVKKDRVTGHKRKVCVNP
jgi:hypothetical protein